MADKLKRAPSPATRGGKAETGSLAKKVPAKRGLEEKTTPRKMVTEVKASAPAPPTPILEPPSPAVDETSQSSGREEKYDESADEGDDDGASRDAEVRGLREAAENKLLDAQRAAMAESGMTSGSHTERSSAEEYVDLGDAANEAKEHILEERLEQLRMMSPSDPGVEKLSRQLQILKRKNAMAKKKREDAKDKRQALETFELKARLCERKRTLESRIQTLTKLGMTLQVTTLTGQLNEVLAKLK